MRILRCHLLREPMLELILVRSRKIFSVVLALVQKAPVLSLGVEPTLSSSKL